MPLKTAKAAQKPVKEFLPASFKLQLEKEEQEREQRRVEANEQMDKAEQSSND